MEGFFLPTVEQKQRDIGNSDARDLHVGKEPQHDEEDKDCQKASGAGLSLTIERSQTSLAVQ
jgi:hypothetical protein